jgi:hypothetical protein
MSDLDDIVRITLEAQVRSAPPMRSPADRVLARAQTVRRNRRLAALTAGVVAVALVLGGVALRGSASQGLPLPPATGPVATTTRPGAAGNRLDLLVDGSTTGPGFGSLLTAGDETVSLAGIQGAVTQAYQVGPGWLALAFTPTARSLWLVDRSGPAQRLIAADSIALAPDGRRLAWRVDGRLHVGALVGTTIVDEKSTPAPTRGDPIAYTGSAVILGYSATGGGLDHFDAWLPGRGDYTPSWNSTTAVITVYQPAADGTLFGLIFASAIGAGTGKSSCLARLDPADNFHPTSTACGLPLTIDPTALVSPDGRWLLAPILLDGHPQTALINLTTVFGAPALAATWDAVAPVGWVDATVAEVTDGTHGLYQIQVGHAGLTQLTVPGQPVGAEVLPVRRLG